MYSYYVYTRNLRNKWSQIVLESASMRCPLLFSDRSNGWSGGMEGGMVRPMRNTSLRYQFAFLPNLLVLFIPKNQCRRLFCSDHAKMAYIYYLMIMKMLGPGWLLAMATTGERKTLYSQKNVLFFFSYKFFIFFFFWARQYSNKLFWHLQFLLFAKKKLVVWISNYVCCWQ